MSNTRLQDFVTITTGKSRITFGDVRRLQRDYLPGGISSREEAESLIHLDARIELTDRAWTDWLVAAVVDFALTNEWPSSTGKCEAVAWLKGIFAAIDTSTRAGRRIMRELRREVARIELIASVPADDDVAASEIALPVPVEGVANELQLAA